MIPVREIQTTVPGYRPTNAERETIILYNETGDPAEIYTHNPQLIRKLDALTEERPDEVTCSRAESINGVDLREYRLPKSWVKIRPSRIISDEEREKMKERGKELYRIQSEAKSQDNYRASAT